MAPGLRFSNFEHLNHPFLPGWKTGMEMVYLRGLTAWKWRMRLLRSAYPQLNFAPTNYNSDIPFVGMDNALVGELGCLSIFSIVATAASPHTLSIRNPSFAKESEISSPGSKPPETAVKVLPAQSESSPADWEQHQAELTRWLDSLDKPIGVFATNDQLAVRLLDACRRAGVAVPEEVAVVGCENEETLCKFAAPALTSVRFDGETVGYRAAETLDRLMKGDKIPRAPVLIPPKGIKVRASSDEFVIEDSIVLRAVRLIREQAFSGITVGEICSKLSVSRSTLERRMKNSLQRGPKEELLRVRYREVNRLLRNTDLTIETIAEMIGIPHPHYLQSSYRDRYGISPGEYRKNNRID